MYEHESQRLISILGKVNNTPDWLRFLHADEIDDLMKAVELIGRFHDVAVKRETEAIDSGGL